VLHGFWGIMGFVVWLRLRLLAAKGKILRCAQDDGAAGFFAVCQMMGDGQNMMETLAAEEMLFLGSKRKA